MDRLIQWAVERHQESTDKEAALVAPHLSEAQKAALEAFGVPFIINNLVPSETWFFINPELLTRNTDGTQRGSEEAES